MRRARSCLGRGLRQMMATPPLGVAQATEPLALSRPAVRGLASGTPITSRGPVSYASLALTLGTGAGLMWYFGQQQEKKVASQTTVGSKVAGAAAIGGPFQLMDQHGKPFSDKNLLGQWSLLYFGFTQCPDICPEELEKIVEAKNLAEKATGKSITTVFISVDPERDSVAQVAEYVKEFDPKMIGLTGTLDQTNAAARAYRVYHSKTGDEKDYLVDHSIITYLLNPQGEFVTFFGKNMMAAEVAESLEKHLRAR
uniref:Thioredoxin domain-containing protein n=1 Tax=Auxenochlorella protothecoides TaxID=3075 RepID=A0A1D1ZNL1_AUXPR